MKENIWTCKIGGSINTLAPGSDLPMRKAVELAFIEATGFESEFIFSGWAGALTEPERAVVENRLPAPSRESLFEQRRKIKGQRKTIGSHYICGCGNDTWILCKDGDCVCAGCLRAQARIIVNELAPVLEKP